VIVSAIIRSKAVAITKHGHTVGIYIPLRPKPEAEDLAAFREAGSALHALMVEKGVSENGVVEDFKQVRKAGTKSRG
jgi:hypothetical protein